MKTSQELRKPVYNGVAAKSISLERVGYVHVQKSLLYYSEELVWMGKSRIISTDPRYKECFTEIKIVKWYRLT